MFKSTSSMPAAVSKHKNPSDNSEKSSSSPIDVDTIDAYIKKNNTFTLYDRMNENLRRLVSKKKFRTVDVHLGITLDGAYIEDRIFAMGYPAKGVEKLIRNDIDQCEKFLEKNHGKNYRVYNLCSEVGKANGYSHKRFNGNFKNFGFRDHCPPSFDLILDFVHDAYDYLKENKDNVIVVHCKAGKGRTGIMICCLLMFLSSKVNESEPISKEAKLNKIWTTEYVLEYYGRKRCMDGQGVTIPSQQKYIRYMEAYLKFELQGKYSSIDARFLKFTIFNLPKSYKKGLYYVIKKRKPSGEWKEVCNNQDIHMQPFSALNPLGRKSNFPLVADKTAQQKQNKNIETYMAYEPACGSTISGSCMFELHHPKVSGPLCAGHFDTFFHTYIKREQHYMVNKLNPQLKVIKPKANKILQQKVVDYNSANNQSIKYFERLSPQSLTSSVTSSTQNSDKTTEFDTEIKNYIKTASVRVNTANCPTGSRENYVSVGYEFHGQSQKISNQKYEEANNTEEGKNMSTALRPLQPTLFDNNISSRLKADDVEYQLMPPQAKKVQREFTDVNNIKVQNDVTYAQEKLKVHFDKNNILAATEPVPVLAKNEKAVLVNNGASAFSPPSNSTQVVGPLPNNRNSLADSNFTCSTDSGTADNMSESSSCSSVDYFIRPDPPKRQISKPRPHPRHLRSPIQPGHGDCLVKYGSTTRFLSFFRDDMDHFNKNKNLKNQFPANFQCMLTLQDTEEQIHRRFAQQGQPVETFNRPILEPYLQGSTFENYDDCVYEAYLKQKAIKEKEKQRLQQATGKQKKLNK